MFNRQFFGRLKPMPVFLLILAFFLLFLSSINYYENRSFRNPISFAISNNILFVLEKNNNTVLVFEPSSLNKKLVLKKAYSIEPDEGACYFMPRKLIRGPDGIVVKSYIYDKITREFLGYRFREYLSFELPPKEILKILLKNPKDYPEINYSCDKKKSHYFVNNCKGHKNIWKIPNAGGVVIEGGDFPLCLQEVGDDNGEFSIFEDICVDADGCIYVSSSETGKIMMYDSTGRKVTEIGNVGFGDNDILAPDGIFFMNFDSKKAQELLTVSSSGTRSWVQFDHAGNPVRNVNLLKLGYPFADILTAEVFSSTSENRMFSFDLANKNFIYLNPYLEKSDKDVSSTLFSSRLKWGWEKERKNSGAVYAVRGGNLFLAFMVGAGILFLVFFLHDRLSKIYSRIKIPFFLKLLLLFIPMLVLSAHIIASWISGIMRSNIEDEYVRRAANLAHAIMNNVSIADLEKIRNPNDRNLPEYGKIFQMVNSIVDSENVDQTPKWIMHKILGGRYYFGINIWKGAIYEPYIIPADRKMFYNVLKNKTPEWGRFSDEQGEWFSYLYPICDAKGALIYVVELYRPSEAIDRAEYAVSARINKVVAFTVVLAGLIVFLFSYLFTRPLKALIRGTEIVSTGNFHHHIEVVSRDELGDLGKAFNKMVLDLRRHTDELKKNTEEKERMQTELRLAREIQRGMLPSVFPPFEGAEDVEIYAEMLPAKDIGGDYYDFFPIDDEHFGVVIADVSGKGIPAALFMMVIRSLVRNISVMNPNPADVVAKLNRLLSMDNLSSSFASLFYIVYNMKSGRIRYCNAGHLPPIKISNGKAVLLERSIRMKTGMLVGVIPDAKFTENELVLEKGETLVLYTDGITETVNGRNVFFGEERLIDILQDYSILPNSEICGNVIHDVLEFQKGLDQFDDITLLFLKHI